MKRLIPGHALAALLCASATVMLCATGCTVGKKRAPGPVKVWLMAEPEAEPMFRDLMADFQRRNKLQVELTIKKPEEIRALLEKGPGALAGQADVVEVGLFDLEAAAPAMQDLGPVMFQLQQTERLYKEAFKAGEFQGKQLFIPWRLSWPVMVSSNKIRPPSDWGTIYRVAQQNPGEVLVPGLDDREFFAFLCSLVWSFGGNPAEPYESGIFEAFQWLQDSSSLLSINSGTTRAADVSKLLSDQRPMIFFEWPQGLVPLILNGSLQLDIRASHYPCGANNNCAVFFFGRYLGIPQKARHLEDAQKLILYLISSEAQQSMIFNSTWLPIAADSWGDLGPRKNGYLAFSMSAGNLKAPPRPLRKIEKAMDQAGKMLLFEHATASQAIAKYRELME